MDRAVGLIMVVTVMMLVAASVMFIYSDQIDRFSSDTDDLSDRGCEFQRERVDDPSELSPECQNSGSVAQIESAAGSALSQLESGN